MRNSRRSTATAIAAIANVPVGNAANGTLAAIWRRFLNWRRHRQAVRDLYRLSDYELRDIGLSRGEIEWAVAHSNAGSSREAIQELREERSAERRSALNYAVGDPRRLPLVE